MDGSTLHICRRDLFCCVWRLDPAVRCRARLVFFVWSSWFRLIYWSTTSQVLLASSAHVPVSSIYYSTTTPCFLVPPCLQDWLDCWSPLMYCYRCTVTDVLFAHMASSWCASSSSCANWSYCTMICVMRIRYGFVSLFGRDVTLLCCAMLTVWTLHSYRCQYWGSGGTSPLASSKTWHGSVIGLARGGCNQIVGPSP